MNSSLRIFSRIAWAGIAGNCALALPLLFAPEWALTLFRLSVPNDLTWTRLSGLLVVLLSLLYMPAAAAPDKLGKWCWLLVGARVAAATFFYTQGAPYYLFLSYDLTFAALLAMFLYRGQCPG